MDLGSCPIENIQIELASDIDLNIDVVDDNLNSVEMFNPNKTIRVLNIPDLNSDDSKKRYKEVPDNVKCEICGVLIQESTYLIRMHKSTTLYDKFNES